MKRLLTLLLALCLAAAPVAVAAEESDYDPFRPAAEAALAALEGELRQMQRCVYVYRDFGDTEDRKSVV